MNSRIYNFGAGPAMLPEQILINAQEELLNWHNLGMSILEIGHRSTEFTELLQHTEKTLRKLLNIPQHYKILFLGGAARTQFAMIPMNFLKPSEHAGYFITGIWSQMAFLEAKKLKSAYCVVSEEANGFKSIPNQMDWNIQSNTSYLYYTPNETVNGVRFPFIPKVNDIPLVADMTSCLLSEPIDVTQYGLIFAGAQKNIANAGLTVVIIREDLLERIPSPPIPTMMNYKIQAEYHSLYATPPVFNCYLAAKMFDWIEEQGGVNSLYHQNCEKSSLLYNFIDSSDFYINKVHKEARSIVNVCFELKKSELDNKFLLKAQEHGLSGLQGHRFVGGLRASIYNAMPIAGVEALINFMKEFEKENH